MKLLLLVELLKPLVDGLLKLTRKAVGMAVKIDDTEKLHGDLKNDYIIQQDLSSTTGLLSLKCGRLMAVASALPHIVDHMVIETIDELKQLEQSHEENNS